MSLILECIAYEKIVNLLKDGPKTAAELAKKTKWKRNMIYGLTRRLRDKGIVEQATGRPVRYRIKETECLLAEVWKGCFVDNQHDGVIEIERSTA